MKHRPLRSRRGTTLVELMAAMAVMTLVMVMAAGCILSGASVRRRIETQNRAQVLLDSALEILGQEVENACGYIKLHESGAMEYLDPSGVVTFLSAEGWEEGGVPAGRLVRWTGGPPGEGTCREILSGAAYQGLSCALRCSFPEEAAVEITLEAYQRGTELVARESLRADLRHGPEQITAETDEKQERSLFDNFD